MKTYRYSDLSQTCVGDLYLPEGDITAETPKVLTIHGGGWSSMARPSYAGVAQFFVEMGFIAFNIDYRLTPEAPWPACGDDCLAAARALIDAAFAPEIAATRGRPVFICGASAGGHLALMTGLRLPQADVRGTVCISGIADPLPYQQLRPNGLDGLFPHGDIDPLAFPQPHLRQDSAPVLLTHSLFDTVVPRESVIPFARYGTSIGADVQTYFYDMGRRNQGHAIWIPNSAPHRLYPDIEDAIHAFVCRILGRPLLLPHDNPSVYLGKIKAKPSTEIAQSSVSVGFETLDRGLYRPELCYDRMRAIGVKHARVQTGWCKCETVKGAYDFAWLDDIVDNLRQRGLQPWFNVGFGNRLYMTDVYGEAAVGFVPLYYGDECLQAWQHYCTALAEHFRGRVSCFEIWNESNLPDFWQPRQADPAEYARLIDVTAQAIRQAIPEARIGGCISGFLNDYLDAFTRQPAILPQMDFFALHPYAVQPELNYADAVRHLRRVLDANGGRHIRIWQGESGFASWAPERYWQPRFVRESQRAQANWLLRRFLIDFSLGLEISSLFLVADMMECAYLVSNRAQSAFNVARQGLLNGLVYTPKAACFALANLCALFHGELRPHDSMLEFNLSRHFPDDQPHDGLEKLAVWKQLFVRDDGQPLYAYYLPVNVQGEPQTIPDAVLSLYDEPDVSPLQTPVLVDLLTGDVRQLAGSRHPHRWGFTGMPLAEHPLVICDRTAVELV